MNAPSLHADDGERVCSFLRASICAWTSVHVQACVHGRPPPQTCFRPVFNHMPNVWGPMSEGNGVHCNVKHVKVITAER